MTGVSQIKNCKQPCCCYLIICWHGLVIQYLDCYNLDSRMSWLIYLRAFLYFYCITSLICVLV